MCWLCKLPNTPLRRQQPHRCKLPCAPHRRGTARHGQAGAVQQRCLAGDRETQRHVNREGGHAPLHGQADAVQQLQAGGTLVRSVLCTASGRHHRRQRRPVDLCAADEAASEQPSRELELCLPRGFVTPFRQFATCTHGEVPLHEAACKPHTWCAGRDSAASKIASSKPVSTSGRFCRIVSPSPFARNAVQPCRFTAETLTRCHVLACQHIRGVGEIAGRPAADGIVDVEHKMADFLASTQLAELHADR